MADTPKDIQKILDSQDNYTCGCTHMGPGKKGMCQCNRTVKRPGEVCNSCSKPKEWHVYS